MLYTDQISANEARDRGCRTIEGANITVVQGPAPKRAAGATAAAGTATGAAHAAASAGARGATTKVDPAEQRARDSDAKRILGDELRREETRLAEMQREFNGGEPPRTGDERNFARYQERVAGMRSAIQRKEADIAAIKRELAKQP